MPSITFWASDLSGTTGYFLWLRKTDHSLVNAGGDSLVEDGATGAFVATVAETLTGLGTLKAVMSASATESDAVGEGWLAEGSTTVQDSYPASASGGAGDASQSTLLAVQGTVNGIATTLAGASKITPVGRIAAGGTVTAYIGDDFKVRSGTALLIPIDDPGAALKAKLDAIGLSNLFFGAGPKNGPVGSITGTVSSITASAGITTISVEISNCGVDLMPGDMPYQIQQSVVQGADYDDFVEIEGTLRLKPRTVAVRG